MKKVTKIYNYLDQEEAQAIRIFIAQSGDSFEKWAKKLRISPTYLSLVLSGKRALTDEIKQRFNELGINL